MPTPPSSPPIDADDTVVVTDIGLRANPKTPTTLDLTHISDASTQSTHNSKLSQLRIVDELFGPLQIGPYSVTRTSLDALGQPLGANT